MSFRKTDFKNSRKWREWSHSHEPWWIQWLFSLSSSFLMLFSTWGMSTPWVTILEILPYVTTIVWSPVFSDHSTSLFLSLSSLQTPWSQILTKVLFLTNSLPIQFDFLSRLHCYCYGSQVFKASFKSASHVLRNQLIQNSQHVKSVSLPDLASHCQIFCWWSTLR